MACFGKALSLDQVRDKLVPCFKTADKYEPLLRTKISLKYVRWWDERKQRRDAPEEWRGITCEADVLVKSLWFMGGQFGVSLEIQDGMLQGASTACPF